jgi:membrane protease YdiL (CAAX protease family)
MVRIRAIERCGQPRTLPRAGPAAYFARRRQPVSRIPTIVPGQILLHLAVFLLYGIGVSAAVFLLPPLTGLAVALVILWMVLHLYLLRRRSAEHEGPVAALRLRPLPRGTLRWVLAAAPVLLLLSWSLGDLYVRVVPVPPQVLNPFGDMVLDPMRRLTIAVLAIALAPVVEELFFRGLIQHALEQRWGAGTGITAASLLFAVVHVDTLPWVIPLHFVLGTIFGWAVWVTRSIWAGVLLHAANNAAAFWGLGLETPPPSAPLRETGMDADAWLALAMLAASLAAGAWIVRGLRRAAAG